MLKLLRIAQNMTAKDLAIKMNVSAAYISEVETNDKTPSLAMLSKYSEALNISKSAILYFEEKGEECGYNHQELLYEILKKIIDK